MTALLGKKYSGIILSIEISSSIGSNLSNFSKLPAVSISSMSSSNLEVGMPICLNYCPLIIESLISALLKAPNRVESASI